MNKKEQNKIWHEKNREKYNVRMREWYQKNKEKVLEQQKKRYYKNHDEMLKRHRGYWWKHREKRLKKQREWYQENKEKHRVRNHIWDISLNGRYAKYRKAAKERNREFLLTKEEFDRITKLPCHYCGLKTEFVGIDRKDNSITYIEPNCLPCCKDCNFLKGSRSYAEFTELCTKIASHLNNPVK